MCRLRRVETVASCSLWAVEAALAGLETGRRNYGNPSVFGKPIRYESTLHRESLNSQIGTGRIAFPRPFFRARCCFRTVNRQSGSFISAHRRHTPADGSLIHNQHAEMRQMQASNPINSGLLVFWLFAGSAPCQRGVSKSQHPCQQTLAASGFS